MGGEDFDHRVMDYFIKLIKKKHKTDISKDSRALQKLRREAERAKRALSSQHQARRPCLPTVLSCAQRGQQNKPRRHSGDGSLGLCLIYILLAAKTVGTFWKSCATADSASTLGDLLGETCYLCLRR